MRIVLDFSMTEARSALDKLMLGLREELTFDMHAAVGEYERELKENTNHTHIVVDADKIVKELVELLLGDIRRILCRMFVIPANGWDNVNELLERIAGEFEKAGISFDEFISTSAEQCYVACVNDSIDEKPMLFELENLSDLFGIEQWMAIDDKFRKAKTEVVRICRLEMEQLLSKLGTVRIPNLDDISKPDAEYKISVF